jgi:hypothetical protein
LPSCVPQKPATSFSLPEVGTLFMKTEQLSGVFFFLLFLLTTVLG